VLREGIGADGRLLTADLTVQLCLIPKTPRYRLAVACVPLLMVTDRVNSALQIARHFL
jgi:hypothetical protein